MAMYQPVDLMISQQHPGEEQVEELVGKLRNVLVPALMHQKGHPGKQIDSRKQDENKRWVAKLMTGPWNQEEIRRPGQQYQVELEALPPYLLSSNGLRDFFTGDVRELPGTERGYTLVGYQ
jgi:hypothetical protein